MGDDDGGAPFAQRLETRLDMLLGDVVHRRGRLVHDQHRRVLEERARNRQALALSAGKAHAPLAHLRIESPRQVFDELHGVSRPRGFDDRLPARRGERAVGDIGGHGVVEEHDLLADEGDVGAQGGQRELADVDAVEQDGARVGKVEARHQVHERALAAAGVADQGQGLTRLDADGNAGERRRVTGVVGEADIAELETAAGAADGARAVVRLGRLVDQREHAGRGREPLLQLCVDAGQALDGAEQHGHGGEEADEAADADLAGCRQVRGQKKNECQGNGNDYLCNGRLGRGRCHEFQLKAKHLVGGGGEAGLLVVLTAEAAHHALTLNGLFEHVGNVAHAVLQAVAHGAQALAEVLHRQHHHRRRDECDERQLPLQIEHPGEQADDGQRVPHQHHEHV